MNPGSLSWAALPLLLWCGSAQAQHLWWNTEGQRNATCLYGQIIVLATHPGIYYCGACWHPGEPAGGYCGIQHNGEQERRTIFSIWDTSASLHPTVTQADPRTLCNRFGGEGEGAHTHMLWPWHVGETFDFFVRKQPGAGDTTRTRYYLYDRAQWQWLHSATISNPNGGFGSVATIGGGLNSFLENFVGRDQAIPKVALYRLWLGPTPDSMKPLTRAVGDGLWGELGDAYFLAEGDQAAIAAVFAGVEAEYGKPVPGEKGKGLAPLPARPLPPALVSLLDNLPGSG